MKRRILLISKIALLVLLFFSSRLQAFQEDSLFQKLTNINDAIKISTLPGGPFREKYEIYFSQPIDHKNPKLGTFSQRVYVMHLGFNKPTVFVTEGYGADYASNPKYREELSKILDANVLFVEHRYFLNSTPSDKNWKYLTAENAANDLHRIREVFGRIYKGKWIVTGISKGGQNAIIYTAYFPNDMDITVPYVAPVCKKPEDGRHEKFISDFAGTPQDRIKILGFQKELLKRRTELSPKFDSLCIAGKYEFNLPNEYIYDYSVLEFSFAFWQWGHKSSAIPAKGASIDNIFKYWVNISGPEYFVKESPNTPFFIQAAKELGYYGYDIKPFKGLLKIKSSEEYLEKLFLPQDNKFRFDNALYKKIERFIKRTDNKMLFVYGEFDPWSSVGIAEQKRDNIVVFIEPNGSHRARLSSLPIEKKNKAQELLKKWLSE